MGRKYAKNEQGRTPSLYEIEVAIARSEQFNYTVKLVTYNVCGRSYLLPIWHECDVLVCTKDGYLTEIEIKRSWSDYLNDYKKDHDHSSAMIKSFYYCVPLALKDKVLEHLSTLAETDYRSNAGLLVIDGRLRIEQVKPPRENRKAAKLSLEQMFYLARLGSMRVISLKSKIAKQQREAEKKKYTDTKTETI